MKEYSEFKVDVDQFVKQIENYDIEPTRKDILNVIDLAKESNPSGISAIIHAVKNVYHINLAC